MVLECVVVHEGIKMNESLQSWKTLESWEPKMVLECVGMNDRSDGPEMYGKGFSGVWFCKLLRWVIIKESSRFGTLLTGALLWYPMQCAGCWICWYGIAMCLLGKFLSCHVAEVSIRDILKSACRHFLGEALSNILRLVVGGTSGWVGVLVEGRLKVV